MGKRPPNKIRELRDTMEDWRNRIVQLRADLGHADSRAIIRELSDLAADIDAWDRYVWG